MGEITTNATAALLNKTSWREFSMFFFSSHSTKFLQQKHGNSVIFPKIRFQDFIDAK